MIDALSSYDLWTWIQGVAVFSLAYVPLHFAIKRADREERRQEREHIFKEQQRGIQKKTKSQD